MNIGLLIKQLLQWISDRSRAKNSANDRFVLIYTDEGELEVDWNEFIRRDGMLEDIQRACNIDPINPQFKQFKRIDEQKRLTHKKKKDGDES